MRHVAGAPPSTGVMTPTDLPTASSQSVKACSTQFVYLSHDISALLCAARHRSVASRMCGTVSPCCKTAFGNAAGQLEARDAVSTGVANKMYPAVGAGEHSREAP